MEYDSGYGYDPEIIDECVAEMRAGRAADEATVLRAVANVAVRNGVCVATRCDRMMRKAGCKSWAKTCQQYIKVLLAMDLSDEG